ncbi:MAG: hypothetical protein LBC73_06130 [Oscillospiraceae bacterium]|jgi:fucokinase|nr:hypothetical protein [Oscillospiraceae bacterium]
MHDEAIKLFWAQSHVESALMLKDAIHSKRAVFWDNVLVTAATNAQADIYSYMIRERVDGGYIPSSCHYTVLADRDELRIGSGGATICALVRLLEECNGSIERLINERNIIIHSGGTAKRLPHSTPWGKLFALSGNHINDDVRNPPGTVFDDLMVSMAGVPSRMSGGVFIVAGDAFFRFSHTQFDLATQNVAVFSTKASTETGAEHGVYVERDGYVSKFLHKYSEQELHKEGAVSSLGQIDLDIGMAFLGENAIRALLSLVTNENGEIDDNKLLKFANEKVNLSFYSDIIYPMAKESTVSEFLKQDGDGAASCELLVLRPELFNQLHTIPLHIYRLTPGVICKMGTTEEALETIPFFKSEAHHKDNKEYNLQIALNSKISISATIGDNCFIEDSSISDSVTIGDNCLISGCDIPTETKIPKNTAIHCVILNDGQWVCRTWGVYDDVKSLDSWLGNKVSDWDENADSLWNAKLFPVCKSKNEAFEWARLFFSGEVSQKLKEEWLKHKRLALSDVSDIDIEILIEKRKQREDSFRIDTFVDDVLDGTPVAKSICYLGAGDDAFRRIQMLLTRIIENYNVYWLDKMRLYMCIAEAVELLGLDINADELRDNGFSVLRHEITKDITSSVYCESLQWKADKIEVKLPVRVNLAGSWSDAPPYCFEHGGTMLNAAVTINGELPIYVCAERIDEHIIEIHSIDLDVKKQFNRLDQLLSYQDPTDTFILYKAALIVTGILAHDKGTLQNQLERLGGGVRITTKVNVPKGSGLGTSSILTGAIISALFKLSGRTRSNEELVNDVIAAEQMMTTGGGWQDTIGGIYPGIKVTDTKPGIPQIYKVQNIELLDSIKYELNKRSFLLFTGQRRIAKSALRRVLTNYICNNPKSLTAFKEIQELVFLMVNKLQEGNINGFGQLLTQHTKLLRQLDNSSSNIMLDFIMKYLEQYTEGFSICGAGGGGFIYGILKQGITLDDINKWIEKNFEGTAIRVYSCEMVVLCK